MNNQGRCGFTSQSSLTQLARTSDLTLDMTSTFSHSLDRPVLVRPRKLSESKDQCKTTLSNLLVGLTNAMGRAVLIFSPLPLSHLPLKKTVQRALIKVKSSQPTLKDDIVKYLIFMLGKCVDVVLNVAKVWFEIFFGSTNPVLCKTRYKKGAVKKNWFR